MPTSFYGPCKRFLISPSLKYTHEHSLSLGVKSEEKMNEKQSLSKRDVLLRGRRDQVHMEGLQEWLVVCEGGKM